MLHRPQAVHAAVLPAPPGQRGFAIYLLVLILGAAATVTAVSMMTSSTLKTREQATHAQILAEAKRALIGWAITRGSTSSPGADRPGDLPAPDTASEGTPDYNGDRDSSGCLDGSRADGLPMISSSVDVRCLGRLPWRDLKMALQAPSEQDAEGRMPWYAVAASLTRIDNCMSMLNPATVNLPYAGFACASATNLPYPWLTVRDTRGNVLSNRVAFVVMVPGAVVGSQLRGASPNLGGASDFLDSMTVAAGCDAPCVPGTYSNADLDNDFIAGDSSATFNDKLLYVTIDELMAAVENQAAATISGTISNFAATYTESSPDPRYLWLAAFNPAGSGTPTASVGTTRGMLPNQSEGSYVATGFSWSLGNSPPVTTSGSISTSEVRSYTVPAGQGSCLWQTSPSSPPVYTAAQRVDCTATVTNPESGVTRRYIELRYTGDTSTMTVSTNPLATSLVLTPANATSLTTRSVKRSTLSSVRLRITDYDDTTTTWSWDPWLGQWVWGPEIVGYGTESASGTSYSITTTGIVFYPTLPDWYLSNEWYRFIYAAIAPGYQPGGANSCAAANSCFSVQLNGNTHSSSHPGVVVSAGQTLSAVGQTRHNTTLSNYFEGNNRISTTLVFDRRTPTSDTFNDQVLAISP